MARLVQHVFAAGVDGRLFLDEGDEEAGVEAIEEFEQRRGIDAKQGRARSEHQGGAGLQSRAAGERHRTDVEVQLVDRRIFENAPRAGHLAQGVVRIAVEKEGPGDCRCCLRRADHRGCLAPFGAADEQIVGLKAALRDLPGAVLGMVFE